jgi:pimeloyl-ACP methyl ester carboxylesterase
MGGYVALAFARRHPARLARLALVDTRAGSDAPEAREARTRNAELATREGPLAVLEAMMPRMLAPGAPEALRDRLRAIARDQRGEGVAAALLAMRDRPDATPVLATLAGVPSLVVVGEHDATTPPEEARRMAAAIPGAELVVIAGAGHLPCIEAPAELADALARWMRAR